MVTLPHAKINLGLSVIRKRQDGYHDIETILYPIGLTDILEVVLAGDNSAGFRTSGLKVQGNPEDNLCVRASHVMRSRYPVPPLSMHLHKKIPSGAGLGGGSSDAAFVIKMLNQVFELGLSQETMEEVAALIGSDCPFFLQERPVFAHGRGEQLEPVLVDLSEFEVIVVKPPVSVSTTRAYQAINPATPSLPVKEAIRKPPPEWQQYLVNDFEDYVFSHFPEVREIKQRLMASGAVYASMTGSGSAVYGLFREPPSGTVSFPGCFVWRGSGRSPFISGPSKAEIPT